VHDGAHLTLLRVPYFWDETYFAAAARDILITGKLVPISVPVESHPPLVYIWLAIWWKLIGFMHKITSILRSIPLRMALACLQHIWHLLVYLNLFVLTALAAITLVTFRRREAGRASPQSSRTWLMLAAVTAAFVLEHSVVGYVTLARYLLPVYPVVMLASLSAIASRVKWWPAVAAVAAMSFVAALFPYTNWILFRRDDNLAYLDYVRLHQSAAEYLANRQKTNVMTVWPASSELSTPWLGYVKQPLATTEIESFTRPDVLRAVQNAPDYILMFPRRTCKAVNPLLRARWWHVDYFRATADPQPEEVAHLTDGRVTYDAQRHCDWIAVLEVPDGLHPSQREKRR
jgi:hypothetical protein